jgi:predicted phage terminase large subunit-like protein
VRRNGVVVQRIIVHDRGPALWPEFWDVPALEAKRIELGPHRFAAMYQGTPVPSEGAVFHRSWWRFYRPNELPHLVQVVQAYDTAFQTKSTADYSVCVTMARGVDGHYYVLDVWRDRVDFPTLRQVARALFHRFRPQRVYVEERASGQSLIQELRAVGDLPVLPYQDRTVDKVTRAHAVTGYVEAGLVRFPEPERAAWVSTVLSEMEFFPHGSHDDIVDAFVIALTALIRHAPAPMHTDDIETGGTVLGNIWQRRF